MFKVVFWNIVVLALLFAVAELGVRVYGHFVNLPDVEFHWMNYATTAEDPLHPYLPDPITGFVHKPGRYTAWGVPITIVSDSTRSNGTARPDSATMILALGDSFTWGYEVGDAETWPAQLERKLDISVINGGVAAYGFDQVVLRGEQLTQEYLPEIAIISLIPDDIGRMQYSLLNGVVRPHFTINGTDLEFHPPDRQQLGRAQEIGGAYALFRNVFGYSLLAHQIMKRIDHDNWFAGRPSIKVHDKGPEVACLLMPRARALAETVLLVWNYSKSQALSRERPGFVDQVSECAIEEGIVVIDFSERLFGTSDIGFYYGPSHMNRAGYEMFVGMLREHLCGAVAACR